MRIVFHSREIDLFAQITARMYLQYCNNKTFNNLSNNINGNNQYNFQSSGKLYHVGTDKFNNQVYLMGRGREKRVVCQALMGFSRIFSLKEGIFFYDLSPYDNRWLYLASLFCRLDRKRLTGYFTRLGVRPNYNRILSDLERFYNKINRGF